MPRPSTMPVRPPGPSAKPPASPVPYNPSEGVKESSVPVEAVVHAQKYAKNAVSALQFNDVDNAIKNLQKALALLTGSTS